MPRILNNHSFNLKGRITIMARNIHIINAIDGKKRKDATPNAKPQLNMAPFASDWLYDLNNILSIINKNVFTNSGAEN